MMKKKLEILIVDDEQGMRETLSDIFKEKDHHVETAEDGLKAIELIKEFSFDLTFLDIKMPGINGVETFKRIKQISPKTIVIMMTAYSLEDLIKEALQEGVYGILYKPLDMDKVTGYLNQAEKRILVLIVDDDINFCETLKNVFNEKNYMVEIAHSDPEALKYAKKKAINIVIIDIKMPVMNGLETYLAMRDVNKDFYAVLVTGYRQETEELIEEALKKNAYTCLYKPFNMDKLISLVEDLSIRKSENE